MSKSLKKILILLVSILALLVITCILIPDIPRFFIMQVTNIQNAGTWEDDPKNWYRAFKKEQPAEVKVIHSKYWKSNHFTDEYIYFFEVQATPEWRDTFLKERNVELVSPSKASSFRSNHSSDITPDWFAPDPVENYDVWSKAGYGSIWINKTNGHIHFYDVQL